MGKVEWINVPLNNGCVALAGIAYYNVQGLLPVWEFIELLMRIRTKDEQRTTDDLPR